MLSPVEVSGYSAEEIIISTDNFGKGEITTCEPIKILLFPPKDKQFRFDESSHTIEIEPKKDTVQLEENLSENWENTPTNLSSDDLVEKSSPISIDSTSGDVNLDESKNELKVRQILKVERVYSLSRLGKNCFLKGCKWSQDGLCLLVNSEDNVLRLFEIPPNIISNPLGDIDPVLQMKEGGTVYDFEWYPLMTSSDPTTCVFACTSQDSPIHLWDAYTGQLRATYQPIDQYDEVTAAYSLAFSPDGSKIYSGFKKCLKVFDISYPGKKSEERNLKNKENPIYQNNIISCISINSSMSDMYALGSYDKTIGIYGEPGELICILKGHSGGVTQIMFSKDGNYLFSGGRKDNEILCWDMRNPGKIFFSVQRTVDTQQRIQFDCSSDQKYLVTGTTNHEIRLFDIDNPKEKHVLEPLKIWEGHEDCVNGVQFHPSLPIIASTSGQRHLPQLDEKEDVTKMHIDDEVENTIKFWAYECPVNV